MTTISGAAAAVTGASGGIGRALVYALASGGADVALADRDRGALEDLARELKIAHPSRKVTVHVVDVSNRDAVTAFARDAIAAHPHLNIVVNNAGVALSGLLHEVSLDDIAWLMGINFWGVVHGTTAFLPHLKTQREAHIVNLSSIFGIVAPPGQSAYSASKFAVRGFSESLRHELEAAKSPVRVSVVHPGGVKTPIARNARVGAFMTDNARRAQGIDRFEAMVQTTPEQAAARIITGIARNEPRILIGPDAVRMDLVQRLKPATYWATIYKAVEKRIAKSLGAK